MKWLKRWKTQTLLLLAVIGPGFITATLTMMPVASTPTRSPARSSATPFFDHHSHDPCPDRGAGNVRPHGRVTGKGLSDLIREEYGLRITFVMMLVSGGDELH